MFQRQDVETAVTIVTDTSQVAEAERRATELVNRLSQLYASAVSASKLYDVVRAALEAHRIFQEITTILPKMRTSPKYGKIVDDVSYYNDLFRKLVYDRFLAAPEKKLAQLVGSQGCGPGRFTLAADVLGVKPKDCQELNTVVNNLVTVMKLFAPEIYQNILNVYSAVAQSQERQQYIDMLRQAAELIKQGNIIGAVGLIYDAFNYGRLNGDSEILSTVTNLLHSIASSISVDNLIRFAVSIRETTPANACKDQTLTQLANSIGMGTFTCKNAQEFVQAVNKLVEMFVHTGVLKVPQEVLRSGDLNAIVEYLDQQLQRRLMETVLQLLTQYTQLQQQQLKEVLSQLAGILGTTYDELLNKLAQEIQRNRQVILELAGAVKALAEIQQQTGLKQDQIIDMLETLAGLLGTSVKNLIYSIGREVMRNREAIQEIIRAINAVRDSVITVGEVRDILGLLGSADPRILTMKVRYYSKGGRYSYVNDVPLWAILFALSVTKSNAHRWRRYPITVRHKNYGIEIRWDYPGGYYIWYDEETGTIRTWWRHPYYGTTGVGWVGIFKRGNEWCIGNPYRKLIHFCAKFDPERREVIITKVGGNFGWFWPYEKAWYVIDRYGRLHTIKKQRIPCWWSCYREYEVNYRIPVTELIAYRYFVEGAIRGSQTRNNSTSVCGGARSCLMNTVV